MTPLEALDRVIHCLDRGFDIHDSGFKTKAFVRAREVVRNTPADEIAERAARKTLTDLDGIGAATARLITEALTGGDSSYLQKIETETQLPISDEAQKYREALRGDCHLHSTWSDGGATIEAMAAAAIALGHDYMVLTDHSARLTIAHGLNRERLLQQLADIEALNERLAPFRILTGMEVDINEDGSLDQDPELLARLDVVVGSVHSALRMEAPAMTRRLVTALADPHLDVLGHVTGRMKTRKRNRPESTFDAEIVFAAAARFDKAIEINSRPERRDPPKRLLRLAVEAGCRVSIDSDAHAPGQLAWVGNGCERAFLCGIVPAAIVNALGADDLLAWTASHLP